MPLDQNLATAGLCVAEARQYIAGSSNKRSDRIMAAGGIDAIIAGRRGGDSTLIDAVQYSRSLTSATLSGDPALRAAVLAGDNAFAAAKETNLIANCAIANGFGNCHELSAIAYELLR
jgi:hypothetical protein